MNFFGAGLLATAGKAGEGAFKGMEKGITANAVERLEQKKQDALAAREKSLAAQQHKYRTKENVQESSLAGGREAAGREWKGEEAVTEREWKSEEAVKDRGIEREKISASEINRRSVRELKVIERTNEMIENNFDIKGANLVLQKHGITDIEYDAKGMLVPTQKAIPISSPDADTDTGDASLDDLLNEIKQGNQSNKSTPQTGLLQPELRPQSPKDWGLLSTTGRNPVKMW